MKYTQLLYKAITCNECNSSENVKVIEIGNYNLILCKKCREKLKELLSDKLELAE